MARRAKDFLVTADGSKEALARCSAVIVAYVNKKRFRYLVRPEVQEYKGRSPILCGKWQSYARIEMR